MLILSLWILVSLSGCMVIQSMELATPNTERPKRPGTTTPAQVFSTSTPLPVASTPAQPQPPTPVPPTPTSTIPAAARLEIRLLPIYDWVPKEYQGEGHIVIRQTLDNELYSIDLPTLNKSQIVVESRQVTEELGIISPDEKWLIRLQNLNAVDPEERIYEVVSMQGTVANTFTLPREWILRNRWVSNQKILADKQAQEGVQVYQTMAISPETGQKQLLPFDYPDIYDGFLLHEYDFNVYDPTLKYVVYPAYLPDGPQGIILRDVENRKNILSSIAGSFNREPAWSPDGKMFVIGSNTYLFGVWLDGSVKSLTHVEQYNGKGVGGAFILRWSPDGSRVAFRMSPSDQPGEEANHCLAVLNVEAESVLLYCVPEFDVHGIFSSDRIIWSPDGQRILVEGTKKDGSSSARHSLLIDIQGEVAFDLGEETEPLYFTSTFPPIWSVK